MKVAAERSGAARRVGPTWRSARREAPPIGGPSMTAEAPPTGGRRRRRGRWAGAERRRWSKVGPAPGEGARREASPTGSASRGLLTTWTERGSASANWKTTWRSGLVERADRLQRRSGRGRRRGGRGRGGPELAVVSWPGGGAERSRWRRAQSDQHDEDASGSATPGHPGRPPSRRDSARWCSWDDLLAERGGARSRCGSRPTWRSARREASADRRAT